MRIMKKELKEHRLLVQPDNLDDLWHLEKVLDVGDFVSASTERKFVTESGKSERKKVRIKINVESIDFHKYSHHLRLLGKIVEGHPSEFVSIGSHHTIEVLPGTQLWIQKNWKEYQLQRLKEAEKETNKPKMLITIMDDELANFVLVRQFGLEDKGQIFSGKSGKDFPSDKKNSYFQKVSETLSNIKSDKILLAGAGFEKENFMKFLLDTNPSLAKKITTMDIGGYGRAGVKEVLRKGVDKILADQRVAQETMLIEKTLEEISKDGLATYGLKQVEEAIDFGAAETVLITDELFSSKRKDSERILEKAEKVRCDSLIVSTEHEAGEQLEKVGGIVALLRFKVE